MPPAVVNIEELAGMIGKSKSTVYKTWSRRVADGLIPPPLVAGKPEWSRKILADFFNGDRPPVAPPRPAPRGRPPLSQPRTQSRLAIMQR